MKTLEIHNWLLTKELNKLIPSERTNMFYQFLNESGHTSYTKWRRPFDKIWNRMTNQTDSKPKNDSKVLESSFSATESAASETFFWDGDKPPSTLEDALKHSNADMEVWKVKKWNYNYWGTTVTLTDGRRSNIQIKEEFERRVLDEERVLKNILTKYSTITMPSHSPGDYDVINNDLFAVVNMYDAHLDKVPVRATTGETGSMEENIKSYMTGLSKIIDALAPYNLSKIYYPMGNDLFHVNGPSGTTKRGTVMEYFCDPQDAYELICDMSLKSIKLLSDIAPVHVPFIKGNHDQDQVHTLSVLADTVFANSPYITIDKQRTQRKYFRHGNCLVGFAHGDKEKNKIPQLPQLMAQENRQNGWWSGTKHSKFYLGDLHHGFERMFPRSKDMPGVSIEFLRSCGMTDTWHHDHGYLGIPKTVYADVWDVQDGLYDRFERGVK